MLKYRFRSKETGEILDNYPAAVNQVGRVLFIGRGINDDWRDITGDVVVEVSVNGREWERV